MYVPCVLGNHMRYTSLLIEQSHILSNQGGQVPRISTLCAGKLYVLCTPVLVNDVNCVLRLIKSSNHMV